MFSHLLIFSLASLASVNYLSSAHEIDCLFK